MEKTKILSMQHIDKSFPGVKALDDVSFELYEGEVLGICGENGAGKSTLLKTLAGIFKQDSGSINFKGYETHFSSPKESIDAGISVIHQELSYLNDLSVAENVFQGRLPLRNGLVDWKKLFANTQDLLDKNNIDINSKATMRGLPLAHKQLIEVIKAISCTANIIVMDEPTSSLGIEDVKKLFSIVRSNVAEGISFIFVSHRLEELFEICDRIIVLRDGRNAAEFKDKNFNYMEVVSSMVGRNLNQLYDKEKIKFGEPIFEVEHLDSKFIHNISFKIHQGEIAGFYGMAGAGQDEIFNTIFGMRKESTGNIYFQGRKLNIKKPIDAINQGIAYITAERKHNGLILNHNISNNIVLATLERILRYGFIKHKLEKSVAEEMVSELKIKTRSIKTIVNNLSGGNQQKVVIAKWLQAKPKIMLLNEPTRGVDVGAKKEIYRIIQELCKTGMAVLMISSDMEEMINMADTIYTVCDGKITSQFSGKDITQVNLMLASIDKYERNEK